MNQTKTACHQCDQLSICSSYNIPIEKIYAIMQTMDSTLNPKIISGLYKLDPAQGQLLIKSLMSIHDQCQLHRTYARA